MNSQRLRDRILLAIMLITFIVGYSACFYVYAAPQYSGSKLRYGSVLLLGGLSLIGGEALFEFIGSFDRVTDPLWLRALHLAILLGSLGLFFAGLLFLRSLA
jgi:hypothetical protein